jgi:hypothetical protein
VNDPGARRFRRAAVLRDRLVHPAWLSRQVHIVGAALGTLLDQFVAVELIGPDGGNDDPAGLDHLCHRVGVVHIHSEELDGVTNAHLGADSGELIQRPARHRPL